MSIHPTAIIDSNARIGGRVKIGPYCYIGSQVTIEDEVELFSHVVIVGITTIGARTKIYPFASIGHPPQDLKYTGEASRTLIGCDNTIREYVTIQPGTAEYNMETKVGNNCLLMVSSHIAHDCAVGNHVILANNATLAGHVTVGDYVIIGGLAAIKQFVRIGAHAIIGGMSGVEKDVIPFGMIVGERAWLNGLNLIGLKRRGFNNLTIQKLQDAYNLLFDNKSQTFEERVQNMKHKFSNDEELATLIKFIESKSKLPLCQPKDL